jgi:hypothetical protein
MTEEPIDPQLLVAVEIDIAYQAALGRFMTLVLQLESWLELALAMRFCKDDDRRLLNSAVMTRVPFGDKVQALAEILKADEYIDDSKLVSRLKRAVERRNMLVHQFAVYGDSPAAPITLAGRGGKGTPLTLAKLRDWASNTSELITDMLGPIASFVRRAG